MLAAKLISAIQREQDQFGNAGLMRDKEREL